MCSYYALTRSRHSVASGIIETQREQSPESGKSALIKVPSRFLSVYARIYCIPKPTIHSWLLRVPEAALIRNKDIFIINHYEDSSYVSSELTNGVSRMCLRTIGSRIDRDRTIKILSAYMHRNLRLLTSSPGHRSPAQILRCMLRTVFKFKALREEEEWPSGSTNRDFLRSVAKNGVIDHANLAAASIMIITLFEFSVTSSIFINVSRSYPRWDPTVIPLRLHRRPRSLRKIMLISITPPLRRKWSHIDLRFVFSHFDWVDVDLLLRAEPRASHPRGSSCMGNICAQIRSLRILLSSSHESNLGLLVLNYDRSVFNNNNPSRSRAGNRIAGNSDRPKRPGPCGDHRARSLCRREQIIMGKGEVSSRVATRYWRYNSRAT